MLAIQRPSMGSSKPPDLDAPFGYNFSDAFPYPSPVPAPGPSLLDDRESQFLDSFFDGVSSDQPFNFDFFAAGADGTDMGMGWDELPPTFMGTQTSFGQQPQMGSRQTMSDMNFNLNSHMNNARPPPSPAASSILGAASFLDNTPRPHSMHNEVLFRGPEMQVAQANGQPRQHSMSQYTTPRTNTAVQEEPEFKDNFYADMVFGTQPGTYRPSQNQAKAELRWGSDVGFGSAEGFVPPANQRKEVAALEDSNIKAAIGSVFIEDVPSSADNTRPSSPNHVRLNLGHQRTKSTGRNHDDNEHDGRLQKRRKSRYEDDEDDESPASGSHKNGSKRRKSAKNGDSPADSLEQNQKRRKSSAAAAAKATRENLTEDQKRENHIKSEQKRRTLIREGFEDLGELVPGLRGGGFSKSAVLIMSADWLEELMQGNEILRQRLAQMQGR